MGSEKLPSHNMATTSHEAASFGNVRARRRAGEGIARAPFAGRIGANQEFVADPDDANAQKVLAKQPDAAPLTSIVESIDLRGFLVFDLWRMALVEGWATCLLIFVLGATSSGLTATTESVYAQTLYAALTNFIALAIFILSAAPASGGHLNPTISIATFFAGLSTLPRTVLYVVAQSTGAIVGGYWLRLGLGDAYFPKGVIPGCTIDPALVSVGQMFALEYMFSQALIFTAFGVGLDPRQGKVFGAALGPIFVGTTLGIGTLASSLAKPGWTGVSFNPARCLGLMVAKNDLQYHYVHWLAPIASAMVNGVFYYIVPPYVKDKPTSFLPTRWVRYPRHGRQE